MLLPTDCLFIICSYIDPPSCASLTLVHREWNDFLTGDSLRRRLFYTIQIQSLLLAKKTHLKSQASQGKKLDMVKDGLVAYNWNDPDTRNKLIKVDTETLWNRLQNMYLTDVFYTKFRPNLTNLAGSFPELTPVPDNDTCRDYSVVAEEYFEVMKTFLTHMDAILERMKRCMHIVNEVDFSIKRKSIIEKMGQALRALLRRRFAVWKQDLLKAVPYDELVKMDRYHQVNAKIRLEVMRILKLIYADANSFFLRLKPSIDLTNFIIEINDCELLENLKKIVGQLQFRSTILGQMTLLPDILRLLAQSRKEPYPCYTISAYNPSESMKLLIEKKMVMGIPSDYIDSVIGNKPMSEDKIELVGFALRSTDGVFTLSESTVTNFWKMNDKRVWQAIVDNMTTNTSYVVKHTVYSLIAKNL